ncbi:hypothetical protein AB0I91_19430 [Actinosynnema sp. NPDC049800]
MTVNLGRDQYVAGRDVVKNHNYGRSQLETVVISRLELTEVPDLAFTPPGEQFGGAFRLLDERGVVVLVGVAGTGKRTAALHLLHRLELERAKAGRTCTPTVVQVDWEHPAADRIPIQDDQGYLLDLSQEDEEELSIAFGASLLQRVESLHARNSHVVVTVTPRQWASCRRMAAWHDVSVDLTAPDAIEVAHKHLTHSHNRPDLLGLLEEERRLRHIQPRSEPRYAAAFAKLLVQHDGRDDKGRTERTEAVEQLRSWPGELGNVFSKQTTHWGRAMLWAVAVGDGEPKAVVIHIAHMLLRRLGVVMTPADLLVAPDLSSQLDGIGATTEEHSVSISATRPNFDHAVLMRVWVEYPDLQEVFLEWLGEVSELPAVSRACRDRIAGHLLAMARVGDGAGGPVDKGKVLTVVESWATSPGRHPLLTGFIREAAGDRLIGPGARARLLAWAKKDDSPLHPVVAEVCSGPFVTEFTERALVRLKHLFSSPNPNSVAMAGQALRKIVTDYPHLRADLLDAISTWVRKPGGDRTAGAGVTAFVELVTVTAETQHLIDELCRDAAGERADLRSLLVVSWQRALLDTNREEGARAFRSWLTAVTEDRIDRQAALSLLHEAAHKVLGEGGPVNALSRISMGIPDEAHPLFEEILDRAWTYAKGRVSSPSQDGDTPTHADA